MAHREPELNGLTKEERADYKAQLQEATSRAIEKLQSSGRRISWKTAYGEVVRLVQQDTGRAIGSRTSLEYLRAFLSGRLERGQIAPPREPTPFRPLDMKRLPGLQRSFERASQVQRPMITPTGYGDYSRSWGGAEGKP